MADSYDLIIIGAGPGGYTAAIRAAQLGLKTAIVEREHMAGICSNWGCIPTKALLRTAEIYGHMAHAKDYGLTAEKFGVDLDATVKRSRQIAAQMNNGVQFLMKKNKVDTIWGEAVLTGPGEIKVEPTKKPAMQPQVPPPKNALGAGTYKFAVRSTEEAVVLIREKLGPLARVLSVRSVPAQGFWRFFSAPRLEELDDVFGGRLKTAFSTPDAVRAAVIEADLVIGCVLIPGAAAPKLVKAADLKFMKPGAVLVDVAIDQGGCFETSHATTHSHPTFVVDGIVHYCVANMPGAVARTSTYALNNVTLPHVLQIADRGWKAALAANPHLAAGLNVHAGKIVYEAVARELGYEAVPLAEVLG